MALKLNFIKKQYIRLQSKMLVSNRYLRHFIDGNTIKFNIRVLASVRAATNCKYFFINVVWSTTVGLGAGT